MLTNNYLEEMNVNNNEFYQLQEESNFAFCYAMVCSQMGN